MDENQIRVQQRKVQDMKNIVEKQEKRIQTLQSSAFELANVYFVFQGVILTAISRVSPSSTTCPDHRWLLFALSSLAGAVNLFALCTISLVYKNALSQQHENRQEHDGAVQRLMNDARMIQTRPALTRLPESENSLERLRHDVFEEAKVYFLFVVCFILFLGFAGVTMAGCWSIPCTRKEYCRKLSENAQKCINLCEGPKCIRVCTGY